jgi:hypothetical protein
LSSFFFLAAAILYSPRQHRWRVCLSTDSDGKRLRVRFRCNFLVNTNLITNKNKKIKMYIKIK